MIIPKIRSGAVASNGMKWEEIYLTFIDEATKLKYTKNGTSPFDWDLFFTLEKYQAHHYFPVNLFADDEGALRFMFENMPVARRQELIDFFNSSSNGIMLPNKRVVEGQEIVIHTNHRIYEGKIGDYLKTKLNEYKEATTNKSNIAQELFDDVKALNFENEVVEQSLLDHKNIDNLNLSTIIK